MAQTFKYGNGIWANKEGSSLAYNDENGNYKPLPFNFERSSGATKINKQNLIETVSVNEPRIDYKDNSKGALLLEPTSTNYFQYSQDFNQSAWQHNADITTTNSSELAPNGGLNANLIEYDGSGYSFIRLYATVPSTAATLSVFAKKGNWRYLGLRSFQGSGSDHTVFDFDTETFSNIASGQTASFEVFPDGWYRIKVTHPSPESNSVVGFAISNSSGYESNTTGGQVANVHLFGAQLEHQSYATSYIPNYGASAGVTRAADAGGSTVDISSELDSRQGTLFFEGSFSDFSSPNRVSLNSSVTTFQDRISISTDTTRFLIVYEAGDVGGSFPVNVSDIYANVKIAVKWSSGSVVCYTNGTESFDRTDIGDFSQNSLDRVSLANANESLPFKGRVKQFRVYDEALSDSELEELTTL